MPATSVATIIPSRSDAEFDVTDPRWAGGARAGDTTGASVDNALEAIRNHIVNVRDAALTGSTALNASEAIIYFPPSTQVYWMTRTFFLERSNWKIVGKGPEQTNVQMITGNRFPCFMFGLPRGILNGQYTGSGYDGTNPLYLSSGHWVDAYGILDSGAVPAANTKWGLNLNSDSYVAAQLSPFDTGVSDGWSTQRHVVIEFAFDPGAGGLITGQKIFGMGNFGASRIGAYPFYLQVSSSTTMQFVIATTGTSQPSSRTITITTGAITSFCRMVIEIDLASPYCNAALNGNQLAVSIGGSGTFTSGNNMYFARNDWCAFGLGKVSMFAVNCDVNSPPVPYKFYGFWMGNAAKYVWPNVTGNAITRVDLATINDTNRYFDVSSTSGCVGCLPLTDPPRGNAACKNDGRTVKIVGSSATSVHGATMNAQAYFLHYTASQTPILTSNQALSGISVQSGGPVNTTGNLGWKAAIGQAIGIAANWETRFTNVNATSCGHGVGSINTGANYTHYFDQCEFAGGDAAYYGCWQILDFKRINIANGGRAGCRLIGCTAKVDYWFSGESAAAETSFRQHMSEYGGIIDLNNCQFDNEAQAGVSLGVIVIEAQHFGTSQVNLNNVAFGGVASGGVLIYLQDALSGSGDYLTASSGNSPRHFEARGINLLSTTAAAIVKVDGTLWSGTIVNPRTKFWGKRYLEQCPVIVSSEATGRSRVQSIHDDYTMPPRGGSWVKNAHVLQLQLPNAGQYSEARCSSGGTMNTATPAVWDGRGTVDDGSGGLGGYLPGNTYFAPITLTA